MDNNGLGRVGLVPGKIVLGLRLTGGPYRLDIYTLNPPHAVRLPPKSRAPRGRARPILFAMGHTNLCHTKVHSKSARTLKTQHRHQLGSTTTNQ